MNSDLRPAARFDMAYTGPCRCVDCGRRLNDTKRQRCRPCYFAFRRAERLATLYDNTTRTANGCLEWAGGRMERGYGRVTIKGRMTGAHRLSYELSIGPIPNGYFVCHSCDNPPCIEPSHLFLGTPGDNSADMVAKGRQRPPRRFAKARLTPETAAAARALLAEGQTHRAVAEVYGVTPSTIWALAHGRTWR